MHVVLSTGRWPRLPCSCLLALLVGLILLRTSCGDLASLMLSRGKKLARHRGNNSSAPAADVGCWFCLPRVLAKAMAMTWDGLSNPSPVEIRDGWQFFNFGRRG